MAISLHRSILVVNLAVVLSLVMSVRSFGGPAADVRYKHTQKSLLSLKMEWRKKYNKASTVVKKNQVLTRLGKILPTKIAGKMFEPWYGTQWAYHGTSTTPGKGAIACGYFVTTVLRDSGVRINRVRMAQAASETMIRKLNSNKNIKRYRKKSIQHFVNEVKKWGAGLYVVGLDYHTGFILNKNNKIYFIHSSFYLPTSVVSEKAITSQALKESNYRVLGKLFVSKHSIKAWLFH